MKDEARTILAVAVLVGVLSFYPVYLKWISPAKPATEQIAEDGVERVAPSAEKQEKPLLGSPSPELPAESPALSSPEELYDLENEILSLTFSNLGGTVKRLEVKPYTKLHKDASTLIDIEKNLRGSYALVFPYDKSGFDRQVFKREKAFEKNGDTIAFSAVKGGKIKISKIYRLLAKESALELTVVFENLTNNSEELHYEVSTQMRFSDAESAGQDQTSLEAGARLDNKVESKDLGAISKKGFLKEGAIDWAFVSKKYFALITDPATATFERSRSLRLNANEITNFALMPPAELLPGAKLEHVFLIYAGAKEYNALKSYERNYQELFSKGFFGTFRVWLLLALLFLNGWLHNWGWSIVAITCVIKLAFTPLTHMSFESLKRMQALQPKIQAIQEKHKKDPQKMNQEVMQLYKKHKANPLGGCLPLVLQMPIFIAFYQTLYQAIELKGAPFVFWITDLSAPDRLLTLPFSLPFLGNGISLLPVLMMGSMIWQQKLTPASGMDPTQTKMMMFMPVIFVFIFYNLPSGLVLYWTLNNLLTIGHQLFTKKFLPAVHLAD
jgi:YidC/Oxa1 family membrane protein insertase